MSLVVLAVIGLVASTYAEKIGNKCHDTNDCSVMSGNNFYCRIGSPTCGSGICSCFPGFTYFPIDDMCRQVGGVGAPCAGKTYCGDPKTNCIDGTCQCKLGYKRGPKGDDCVLEVSSKKIGGECYDNAECYYELVCLNNVCACPLGMKSTGTHSCTSNEAGDSCATAIDCRYTTNTVCLLGKCTCVSGTDAVPYQTTEGYLRTACQLGGTNALAEEGQRCVKELNPDGTGRLCLPGLRCESCGESILVCTRPSEITLSGSCAVPSALALFGSLLLVLLFNTN